MSTIQINCRAILSDLDGTLIDSLKCVDYAWEAWATDHALDIDWIKKSAHGMRTADSLKLLVPHLDLATEMKALEDLECSVTTDLVEIAGAKTFLNSLPKAHWAIVTSGSRRLANHRLGHVGLPRPTVFVTADDVTAGKPDPQCYLKAAQGLGIDPADCIVLEDSPAGIKAGKAAGARVIAIGFSRADHDISAADFVVHDLTRMRVVSSRDGTLMISLDTSEK
ncbi:MAG: HAD family hydrolase [Cyanobacteria bacterium REEB67]|nr:HAD family hydrolase [Cyanobacteria bacterium REEB67]